MTARGPSELMDSLRDDEIPMEFNDVPQTETEGAEEHPIHDGLQTFVFSATLSKDLQRNLKKRARLPRKQRKGDKPVSTLGSYSFAKPA
jgi:ATP-dependent RNA helicase DDX24/MAK5